MAKSDAKNGSCSDRPFRYIIKGDLIAAVVAMYIPNESLPSGEVILEVPAFKVPVPAGQHTIPGELDTSKGAIPLGIALSVENLLPFPGLCYCTMG